MFLKKIKKILEEWKLIYRGDRVLIGVSAGLDSITLLETLHVLKDEFAISLYVSHYDHKIRKDSHLDALFVYEFCKKRGIPFFCTASPVSAYAKREGLSLEMAGRELRYRLWYWLAKTYDFHKIALAHHLDDLIEEVFLKLIKGTGKRGLAGIPLKREDLIIRPFLFVSKREIRNFAEERGLSWRDDPTNTDLRIPRNKIRHLLIPFLEKNFSTKIRETLKRTAIHIAEEEEFIEEQAIEIYRNIRAFMEEDLILRVLDLKGLPPVMRRRIYFLAFKDVEIPLFRVNSRHLAYLEALVARQAKGPIYLPGGVLAYRGPGYLRFTKKVFTLPYYEILISKEGVFETPLGKLSVKIIPRESKPPQNSRNFQISADNLTFPIIFRKRKPGDRIFFPGIGHKKLKKYLQEKRIPAYLRDSLPVVEAGNQIIGVWNVYINPKFLVSEGTQKILLLELDRELPSF